MFCSVSPGSCHRVQLVIQPTLANLLAGLTDSRKGRRGSAGIFLK